MTTRHRFFRRVPGMHTSVTGMALLLAIACSQPTSQPPAMESSQVRAAKTTSLPKATLPNGTAINLELAITQEELANGLMFRPSLPADRGMFLLFEVERHPSIWMKNTLISLDLIYLDNSGVVVGLTPDVPPCAADPCPTYPASEPTRAVLEMVAGSIATHALQIGDILEFEKVPGYPVTEAESEEESES